MRYLLVFLLLSCSNKKQDNNLLLMQLTVGNFPTVGTYLMFPTVGTTIGFVSVGKVEISDTAINQEIIQSRGNSNDWCSEEAIVFLSCNHSYFILPDKTLKFSSQGIDRWWMKKEKLYYLEKEQK